MVKKAFFENQKAINTSIPGHIIAFDPDTQLAQIQIGIVRLDINGNEFNPPPIIECLVFIPGGSEHLVEFQINPNDECWIDFSQRCIDGWVNTGGIAQQPIVRFHDKNDACAFVGTRSQPNKITGYSNDGIRLRNKSGDAYAWLKSDETVELRNGAGFVTLQPDGTVNINGLTIDPAGNLVTPTTVTASTVTGSSDVVSAGISGKSHIHGGVSRGNQNTDGPQ